MDPTLRRVKLRPLGAKPPASGPVEHWVERDSHLDDATQELLARAHGQWDELRDRLDRPDEPPE